MTDTITTDPAVRVLPIAPGGEVDIFLASNTLRIRGTDGDRVVVRSHDGRPLEGEMAIDDGPAVIRIRDDDANVFHLGPIVMRTGRSLDLDVEIPRTTRLAVRTMSGDVQAIGIGGASRWATASGRMLLQLDGGPASVETLSGDVTLHASAPLDLAVRSVSGDLRVEAPMLTALTASTASGDIDLAAGFAGGAIHSVTSVSGDVRLRTGSALRLETRTVTGDVRASVPHRAEGGRGRRTIVVGDGRAKVTVSTLSGDVSLDGGTADAPRQEPAPNAEPAWDAEPARNVETAPDREPVRESGPVVPAEPVVVVAEAEAAANLVRPMPPVPAAAPMTPAAVAPPSPAFSPPAPDAELGPVEDHRLEILRALERGDLDVEQAASRLRALDAAPVAPEED